MDVQGDGGQWPLSMGDYVRLRNGGLLGEVIDVAITRASCRHTVNVFTPRMAEPISYRLEDLESVWPAWPTPFTSRRRDNESPLSWRALRPS